MDEKKMERYSAWYEKYSPVKLDNVIGNGKTVEILKKWISEFASSPRASSSLPVLVPPKPSSSSSPSLFSESSPSSSPVPVMYIYGAGGIGKSSLASLLLKNAGYRIFELNAGDIRSKKRIQDLMEKVLSNHSIDMICRNGKDFKVGILMDDIDGMSCGDKGGLYELFATVFEYMRKSAVSVPVVCISNKPYDKKLSASLLQEIKIEIPSEKDIIQLLAKIAAAEEFEVSSQKLAEIVKLCNRNIRKCLILLEDIHARKSDSLVDYEANTHNLNLFQITSDVYKEDLSFSQIHEMVCFDYSLIPMMVHENVVSQMQKKVWKPKQKREYYHLFIYQLTLGDVMNRHLHLKDRFSQLHVLSSLVHCQYINATMKRSNKEDKDTKPIRRSRQNQKSESTDTDFSCGVSEIPEIPSTTASKKSHIAASLNGSSGTMKVKKCKEVKEGEEGNDTMDIIFTNSLSKSATQSNAYNTLCISSQALGVDYRYLSRVLPLVCHEVIELGNKELLKKLDQGEFEKIVHIVQKWKNAKLSTKDKKKIKQMVQKNV